MNDSTFQSTSAVADDPRKGGAVPRHVPSPTERTERGFRAMLQDAGLWGLVQLRCESRTRSVVRVTSPRGVGYLYFADGQIVHAAAGNLEGERGALHILAWSEGTWDTCERAWPTSPSIGTSWQGLLLRAAQLEDEARRPSQTQPGPAAVTKQTKPATSQTKAPPPMPKAQNPATTSAIKPIAKVAEQPAPAEALPAARADESGVNYRAEDYEHALRMDSHGEVLAGHGDVEEHAALAAYACRIGDLVGELLGMGNLVTIDTTLRPAGRCLIFREASGDTIVLRPRPNAQLGRLKAQLHL